MLKQSRNSKHFLSSKLKAFPLPEKGGFAIQAQSAIHAGELLVVWGGDIVTGSELETYPNDIVIHGIQIEDDLYQVPGGEPQPADYVNHSCNPNTGLGSPISLIAMRDIAVGEEICFDYAMSDSSPYDEFDCQCGADACRIRITGEDWKRADLQERYAGYFSPYLARRIEQRRLMQDAAQHHTELFGQP